MQLSKIQCAFLIILLFAFSSYFWLVALGCSFDDCSVLTEWIKRDEPALPAPTESTQNSTAEASKSTTASSDGKATQSTSSSTSNKSENPSATTSTTLTKSKESTTLTTTTAPTTLSSTTSVSGSTAESSSTGRPTVDVRKNNPWWTCPEPGKGRQSVIIGALVEGRLGNVVWSYLSLLITAKLYGLRPVLHNSTISFMVRNAFDVEHVRIPTLEWMDAKCNMSGWLDRAVRNESMCKTFHSRDDLFAALENPPKVGLEMYRYVFFVTTTELLVPYFYELKEELVLKKENVIEANKQLNIVKSSFTQHLRLQGLSRTDFEFVGVHVRRTDYLHHMKVVHSKGKVATPKFFHTAMDWLKKELSKPLVFVVVSDDRNWTRANIVADRKDVYLGGDSNITNPGIDLAILAACNHTIFAYGTYGLTGAFLASRPGGYTIVFDPENGTITKEMEFASNLPGWRIMTEDGRITYRKGNPVTYAFYGHPPPRTCA